MEKLQIQYNKPCSEELLTSFSSQYKFPKKLLDFYAKHDGALTYNDHGDLQFVVWGLDFHNIVLGDVSRYDLPNYDLYRYLYKNMENDEDYQVIYETKSMLNWNLDHCTKEEQENLVHSIFHKNMFCIATEFDRNTQYWLNIEIDDLYFFPSPQYSVLQDLIDNNKPIGKLDDLITDKLELDTEVLIMNIK